VDMSDIHDIGILALSMMVAGLLMLTIYMGR